MFDPLRFKRTKKHQDSDKDSFDISRYDEGYTWVLRTTHYNVVAALPPETHFISPIMYFRNGSRKISESSEQVKTKQIWSLC